MGDRADAAQALDEHGHFPERAPLHEFLEAAELDDVQTRLPDMIVLVEEQRHLAVAFDPADGLDDDASQRNLGGSFGLGCQHFGHRRLSRSGSSPAGAAVPGRR